MKCTMGVGGKWMDVAMDGELLKEYLKHLGSKIIVDVGIVTEVKSRFN